MIKQESCEEFDETYEQAVNTLRGGSVSEVVRIVDREMIGRRTYVNSITGFRAVRSR
jgi:hypothetical protein